MTPAQVRDAAAKIARERIKLYGNSDGKFFSSPDYVADNVAAHIELIALDPPQPHGVEGLVEDMANALEPFAKEADYYEGCYNDMTVPILERGRSILVSDIRKARTALSAYHAVRKEQEGVNKFSVHDLVEKVSGYRFPGIVRIVGTTDAGEVRYVVEADNPDFKGMLHIFAEGQLIARKEQAK